MFLLPAFCISVHVLSGPAGQFQPVQSNILTSTHFNTGVELGREGEVMLHLRDSYNGLHLALLPTELVP